MMTDRPLQVGDIVQPSERFKQLAPWSPRLRVFGRITEIEPDVRIETIHVPGGHPIHRVGEDRTQYCVTWKLPYGDLYVNWHRKEMLDSPPPLIALANCAPDEDEFDYKDDG